MIAARETKEEKQAKVPKKLPEVILEPMPTLIRLTEFINSGSITKTYKVETLGGFLNWVKDKAPAKLPFDNWKKLLDQFANRIV